MEEDTIKISKGYFDVPLFILVVIIAIGGILCVSTGKYLMGGLLFLLALFFLTIGHQTIFNFREKRIEKALLIYFVPLFKNDSGLIVDNFDTVELTQYSETGGAQFRTHVSSFKIREYHIILKSSISNKSYRLPDIEDYKFARQLILRMKKEWGYTIKDHVYDKILENKRRR